MVVCRMMSYTFASPGPGRCPIKMVNRAGELMCAVVAVDDVRVSSAIFSQVFVVLRTLDDCM